MRALFFLVLSILSSLVSAQENTGLAHKRGGHVPLYANKVGPFANPSEQYEFYTLPFCAPREEERKSQHLGENLGGDRMMRSLYTLPFLVKFIGRTLCSYTLQPSEIEAFQRAIAADYYFELIYDGHPVRGFVGEHKNELIHGERVPTFRLFTHSIFTIIHDGERVLGVSWEHDPVDWLDITDKDKDLDVHFRYSARWIKATAENANLLHKGHTEEQLQIRWFSILNSIGTVLLLTGFLAGILMRVLKNDFTRYAKMEQGDTEETGWKLVHGDVFRFPQNKELLCAILGNGVQLLTICLGVLLTACLGLFGNYYRGQLLVGTLVLFAVSSCWNGMVSAAMYVKMGGQRHNYVFWLSYGLFLFPFFVTASILNFIAVAYNSSTAIPFITVLQILGVLVVVSLPINFIWTLLARNYATPMEAPCRTAKVPRAIPVLPWHRQGPFLVFMAGFLPFSVIYIELYFIFASVWGQKLYSLYGILLLVFIIMVIVTAFVTIALTYFQLAIEDHRWWWRSVNNGGITGLYIFLYCFYYFMFKARMHGFLQTSFFFGYMGVVCVGAWLVLGTVGFFSSYLFIKYIYSSIKCD